MSKSRFPVLVKRYFTYSAFIRETGEILQCDTFKSLYNIALSHLKTEISSENLEDKYYDCCTCSFEFGYCSEYWEDDKHCYYEWESLTRIGYMYVSTISIAFLRFADFKEMIVKRGDN